MYSIFFEFVKQSLTSKKFWKSWYEFFLDAPQVKMFFKVLQEKKKCMKFISLNGFLRTE